MYDFTIKPNPNNPFDFDVLPTQEQIDAVNENFLPKELPFVLHIDNKTFKMYFNDSKNILHILRVFLS